jgi:hypothetical protein
MDACSPRGVAKSGQIWRMKHCPNCRCECERSWVGGLDWDSGGLVIGLAKGPVGKHLGVVMKCTPHLLHGLAQPSRGFPDSVDDIAWRVRYSVGG